MSVSRNIEAAVSDARSALDELAIDLVKRGADKADVDERVSRVFTVLYELTRLDAALTDRRRRETVELVEVVGKAHAAGATVQQLAERFERSPSRIYGLLAEFRMTRSKGPWLSPAGRTKEEVE